MGLDLGQSNDYTAITIMDRFKVAIGEPVDRDGYTYQEREARLHLRHIERFPLGTSYPDIVRRVEALSRHLGDLLVA
jgi:hypothetical protein